MNIYDIERIEIKTSRIGARIVMRVKINHHTFFVDCSRDLDMTYIEVLHDNDLLTLVQPISNPLSYEQLRDKKVYTHEDMEYVQDLIRNAILGIFFEIDSKDDLVIDRKTGSITDEAEIFDHWQFNV